MGRFLFPKDVSALVHTANDYGYDAQLLKSAIKTNQNQRLIVLEKLQQVLKILKGKTIGLLGLTFKPDTDDLRDAPALDLIAQLSRLGAKVKAYDPIISPGNPHLNSSEVTITGDIEQLAHNCDALVLVTEWQQFRELDYLQIASKMTTPIIIDGRNFLDPKTIAAAGFYYIGIGRCSNSVGIPKPIL